MLKMYDVTGKNCQFLRNFYYEQPKGTMRVIYSRNHVFLDEFECILKNETTPESGLISLNGRDFSQCSRMYLDEEEQIYLRQTVLQNIFSDLSFFEASRKKRREELKKLFLETGISVDPDRKAFELSAEEKKTVELLRICRIRPDFLLVNELNEFFSVNLLAQVVDSLKKICTAGTTVLYITKRAEEAMLTGCDVALAENGRIRRIISAEKLAEDPASIYDTGKTEEPHPDAEKQILISLRQYYQKKLGGGIGNSAENMLKMFSDYLVHELQAESAVLYLINKEKQTLIDCIESRTRDDTDIPRLRESKLFPLLEQQSIAYYTDETKGYRTLFQTKSVPVTMVCHHLEVHQILVFIQINYSGYYVYSQRDAMMIQWIAQEIGIYLENSRLMGSSVLLRESHHRIKNNLQIIVSLLEMEKLSVNDTDGVLSRNVLSDAFNSAIDRIKCIAGVHDLLARNNGHSELCEIEAISQKVCDFYRQYSTIDIEAEKILVPYAKAVSIALVINEIVSNSIKHNHGKGDKLSILISIDRQKEENTITICCMDNGVGFPEEEDMDMKNTGGVGSKIIESIIMFEFEGMVEQYNAPGAVTRLTIPEKALLPVEPKEIEHSY